MPQSAEKEFNDVLAKEKDVTNRRRERIAAEALVLRDYGYSYESSTEWAKIEVHHVGEDERGHRICRLYSKQEIVGLALSGGGVRSAAFCQGVLQGLDAVNPNDKPQVLDTVDYLSTVSGGGYIGASYVAGVMQTKGRFPFESKLDSQETLETKWIRDHSNYLIPDGFRDVVAGLVAVIRGLTLNAIIFLAIILFCAAVTVTLYPMIEAHSSTGAANHTQKLYFSIGLVTLAAGLVGGLARNAIILFETIFLVVWITVIIYPSGVIWIIRNFIWIVPLSFFLSQIVYPIILRFWEPSLLRRETIGKLFGGLVIVFALAGFALLQPSILHAYFDFTHPACLVEDHHKSQLESVLHWIVAQIAYFPQFEWMIVVVLLFAATALVTTGGKLAAVAHATRADQTWTGSIKHWASRVALYTAAIVVPLLIWLTYLAFCYWGIEFEYDDTKQCYVLPHVFEQCCVPSHAFEWLKPSDLSFAIFYFGAFLLFFLLSLFIEPNATSLHGYYRDRLSRAFLWNLDKIDEIAKGSPARESNADQFTLSSQKKKEENAEGWADDVRFAPYLLMNTAINLEGSEYLNLRGRNADSFFFQSLLRRERSDWLC